MLILNTIDNADIHITAHSLKDEILEEVELYKLGD